jgi:hypothetical protein
MKGSKTHLPYILCAIALLWVLNCNQQVNHAIIHLDVMCAHWANGLMAYNPAIGKIFGTLNTRVGDAGVLFCFGVLFLRHALKGSSEEESIRRLSWWGWVGVVCVTTYLLSCLAEPYICRKIPLATIPELINVQKLYGVALHTDPESSFPSGHGFAYFFFILMAIGQYTSVGIVIACIGSIMLLSRLVVGVHWLSDISLGALPMALLMQSVMCTAPLQLRGFIQRLVTNAFLVRRRFLHGDDRKKYSLPAATPAPESIEKLPALSSSEKRSH